ncbi:MAG: c-type cytochrome [Burkholderiales bacterium]
MRSFIVLAVFSLLAAGVAVDAGATEQLLKKNRCVTCHTLDKKTVGPSFKDVAARYKADKEAEARLVRKVLEGGKGAWGALTMPAKGGFPDVPEGDIQPMVRYILSL